MVDQCLVYRAQIMGHQYVHRVANLLTVYIVGHELGTPEHILNAQKAEKELRLLIMREELERMEKVMKRTFQLAEELTDLGIESKEIRELREARQKLRSE